MQFYVDFKDFGRIEMDNCTNKKLVPYTIWPDRARITQSAGPYDRVRIT